MTGHGSKASSSSQCRGESFDRDDLYSSNRFAAAVGDEGPTSERPDVFVELEAGMHYHKQAGTGYVFGIPLLGE
jgi:hypothetical protein